VAEETGDFFSLGYYAPVPNEPYFILDWGAALDPRSGLGTTGADKFMRAMKRNGYYARRIVPTQEFLCARDRFVVIDAPGVYWYEDRVQKNPDYVSRELGKSGVKKIIEVRRVAGSRTPCP
jgi:hypothetical protein